MNLQPIPADMEKAYRDYLEANPGCTGFSALYWFARGYEVAIKERMDLEKDKARLDWLEQHKPEITPDEHPDPARLWTVKCWSGEWFSASTLREALSDAMRKDTP